MPLHHRDTRARFPTAKGTCKWCGRPCPATRSSHPECADAAQEAREYRPAALKRSADLNGGKPACVYRRLSETPCSGTLEAHHVQELADNGDPGWTVIACGRHHQEQTNAAAAARRGTPMATKTPAKKKSRPAEPERTPGQVTRDTVIAAGLLLAGLAGLWRMHTLPTFDLYSVADWRIVGGAVLAAGAAYGLLALAVGLLYFGARKLARRRARTHERYRDVLARATHTPPQAMRVKLSLLPGRGSCWYASTFDDAPGSRARLAVHDALELKAGRPLHLDWTPAKDTVSWRPVRDDDLPDAPQDTRLEPVVLPNVIYERLTESMRAVLGDKRVTVDVLNVAGSGRDIGPTAFDVHYSPGVPIHREAIQDELEAKVNSLYPTEHPNRWRLTNDSRSDTLRAVLERDPLADVVHQPDPTSVDLTELPIGVNDRGEVVTISLHEVHLLIAGQSGSGKGSIVWALLHSLAPAIHDGSVVVHGLDPKRTEFGLGRALFTTFVATQQLEKVKEFVGVVERIMEERKDAMEAAGIRAHVASPESPHHVMLVDEWAAATQWIGNKRERDDLSARLALIFTQGRALGISVVGATQNPLKEVLAHRDYFTARLSLSVSSKSHVDMILGEGLRGRGARSDTIGLAKSARGIGYLAWDMSDRDPLRFRAYFHTDDEVRSLAERYAAPGAWQQQLAVLEPAPADAEQPAATTPRTASTPDRPAGYAFALPGTRWLSRYADQLRDDDVIRRGRDNARIDDCETVAVGEDGEEQVELHVTLQRGGESAVWTVPADEEIKVRA